MAAHIKAVRAFVDRLQYVCQWEEVARDHARLSGVQKDRLDAIRQVAMEHNRLAALEAAMAQVHSVPILNADLAAAEVHEIRQAIIEAVMALTVRDLIPLEQFWALYRSFAALIPLDLPLDFGRGYRALPTVR